MKKIRAEADGGELTRRRTVGALLAAGAGVVAANTSSSPVAAGPPSGMRAATDGVTSVEWIGTAPAAPGVPGYPNLRNLVGRPGEAVVVDGFWRRGDGGGGLFCWDTAGLVDDGGTVIVPAGASPGAGWRRLAGSGRSAADTPNAEYTVTWFGARGDLRITAAASDPMNDADPVSVETAAIERALAVLRRVGGTLVFPPGRYVVNRTLDLSGVLGARLIGLARRRTIISYDQPHGSLLALRSASDIQIEQLSFSYSNPAFDGVLVNHDRATATSGDTGYIKYANCSFSSAVPKPPNAVTGAYALLRLAGTICSTVQNCIFLGARHGIVGRDRTGVAAFSNANEITGCVFAFLDGHGIYTPGQSWTIRNCTFEADAQGRADGIGTDPDMGGAWGVQILGNWFGDMSAPGKDWITLFSYGTLIAGNFVYAATNQGQHSIRLLKGTQGATITGNQLHLPIAFGTAEGQLVNGVSVIGNDFGERPAPVTFRGNARKLVWLGNWDAAAYEQVTEGLHVNGYLAAQPAAKGIAMGMVIGERLMPANSLEGAVGWIGSVRDTDGRLFDGTVALIGRSDTRYAEAAVLVGQQPQSLRPYTAQRWGGASGVPGVPNALGLPWSYSPLVVNSVGPTLDAARTLVPNAQIQHVRGTATISTIYPPAAAFRQNGGRITLIPDAAWSLDTTGNIGRATTAVTGRPLDLVWDGTTWWPSY